MKITFIDPPVLVGNRSPERVFGCTYGLYSMQNVFLLITAAVLEQKGHEVKYINMPLKGYCQKEYASFLKEDESDIYCFYSVNLAKKNDISALEHIRRERGNVPVFFMGPGPTYDIKYYLRDERCFVIRGEPDYTVANLVDNLETPEKVNGVSFLINGSQVDNPTSELVNNLDELPFPARHLVDKEDYFNPKLGTSRFTSLITSRGCPYRCLYCVPNSLSFAAEIEHKRASNKKIKPRYRVNSPKRVIEEFKMLKEQGYKSVAILDDEFAIQKKRVLEICEGIKGLGIKWGCLARADSLDEETVKSMAESGCTYVDIGVESFDQKILDYIQKDIDVNTIETAITLLKRYGIMAKANILFGASPYETKESIRKTLEGIKKTEPDSVMFSICNPFPGTDYYEIAKKENWFIHGDYVPMDVQKQSNVSYPGGLSNKELENAVRKANFSFFLRPKFVLKQVGRMESVSSVFKSTKALMKKLF